MQRVILVLLAGLLAFGLSTPAVAEDLDQLTSYGVGQLLADINAKRDEAHEPALQLDSRLSAIATAHARDMAEHQYFSHFGPDGSSPADRLERAHYSYHQLGENIALASGVLSAARGLWNSPTHRHTMLMPEFRKVGIGLARWGQGTLVVVEDFSD